MKNLRKITSNILTNFLKIRKGDIVLITSDIYDYKAEEPLIEFPMVEALMLELILNKTHPLLNVSLQSVQKTLIKEKVHLPMSIPDKINRNFIDSIDTFIEVGWRKLSREILSSHDKSDNGKDPQIFFWHKIFENKKNLVFLNYPTPELSSNLNCEHDQLLSAYYRSINCDYVKLKTRAEELKDEFFSYGNYQIISNKEKLKIKIIKDKYQFFMGSPLDHQITVLPAGVIEFPLDKVSLDGVFFAEKIYYKNLIYENVKLSFSDGVIEYISFKTDEKGNYALQNTIMNSLKECYFSLGFNPEIHEYTNFYLYDRCIKGNISLKFFDNNSFPIVFSNVNAEIKKRKRIFMNNLVK